jgi:hypothetical protein
VDYAMRVVSADNAGVRIEATEWVPPPGVEAQGETRCE